MTINIMTAKDIRFDPIWRYVIPCHFHWPLRKINDDNNNNNKNQKQQKQQQRQRPAYCLCESNVTTQTGEPFIRLASTHTYTSLNAYTHTHGGGKTTINKTYFAALCCIWSELMFCSGWLLILMKLAVSCLTGTVKQIQKQTDKHTERQKKESHG